MKLPWDRNYLKIAFHVVVTLAAIYILYLAINFAKYILTDFDTLTGNLGAMFGGLFKVFNVVVIALIIAYLFDPLVDFFQKSYAEIEEKKIKPFMKNKIKPSLAKFYNKKISPFINNKLKVKKWKIYTLISRLKKEKKSTNKLGKNSLGKSTKYSKRTAGTIITYLLILSVLFFGISTIFSKIGIGAKDISFESVIGEINKTANEIMEWYNSVRVTLQEYDILEFLSDSISDVVNTVSTFIKNLSSNLMKALTTAGTTITDFMLALIVSFYLLKDKAAYMKKANMLIDNFIPEKTNQKLRNLFSDIHAVFSGYIRGQLTDAIIMGTLISIALSIIGVPFAVVIGIFSGFAQIIPYFGAFIAFIISVVVAFLSGEPIKALYAAIAITILQQLDGMFIVPRVVGKKVELSPAMVIISLSIGGSMFGLMGMVFAVPSFAILNILFTRYINRRMERKGHSSTFE